MSDNKIAGLHDFLVSEGRSLANVKFFPGSDHGMSSEQLAEAALGLLAAIGTNPTNNPPVTGLPQRSVRELFV